MFLLHAIVFKQQVNSPIAYSGKIATNFSRFYFTEALIKNHFACLGWPKDQGHKVTQQHTLSQIEVLTTLKWQWLQKKSSRKNPIHLISKNYLHQSMQQTYHLILWTYRELAASSEMNLKMKFRLLNMKKI